MIDSKFKFIPETHTYLYDGKRMTGVTTILGIIAKPQLINWAANMGCDYIRKNVAYAIPGADGGYWAIKPSTVEEAATAHSQKRDKAADEGTKAHKLVELWIRDSMNGIMSDRDYSSVQSFINWAVENKVKFLEVEKSLYDKERFIAGTCDFTCEIGGKKMVGDLKTGKSIYYEAFVQTAAYMLMLGGEYDGSLIVHLPQKGELKIHERYDHETDKQVFLSALNIYRAKQAWEKENPYKFNKTK